MSFIEVIEPEESSGSLKEIDDELIQSRGMLAMVHKIQSLNLESITARMDLYMQVMFGKSSLKGAQRCCKGDQKITWPFGMELSLNN